MNYKPSLCILDSGTLSNIGFVNVSFYVHVFTLLMVSFETEKFSILMKYKLLFLTFPFVSHLRNQHLLHSHKALLLGFPLESYNFSNHIHLWFILSCILCVVQSQGPTLLFGIGIQLSQSIHLLKNLFFPPIEVHTWLYNLLS